MSPIIPVTVAPDPDKLVELTLAEVLIEKLMVVAVRLEIVLCPSTAALIPEMVTELLA